MQNIELIVKEYLSQSTDYAILLDGEWGVGKTYIYKLKLKPLIEATPLPDDESKKYKCIYISLFGVKSKEEFENRIALELYPLLKSKVVKTTTALLGAVGISLEKFGIDLKTVVEEANAAIKNAIDFNPLFIVLDDFERADSSFTSELVGLVNSLIENQNAKVLIIGNTHALDENLDASKNSLFDKVIGIKVNYKPPFATLLNSFISDKYGTSDQAYHSFLIQNKRLIYNILSRKTYNLRSISFALGKLQNVWSRANGILNRKDISKKTHERYTDLIINFVLGTSIELKHGRVTKEQIEASGRVDINGNALYHTSIISGLDGKQEPFLWDGIKSYFYPESSFHFLPSIFRYIVGDADFDLKTLESELLECFPQPYKDLTAAYLLLNLLDCNEDSPYFPSKEYVALTRNMISKAYNGEYDIKDYHLVYQLSIRFNNLLGLNIPDFVKRLCFGLNKSFRKPKVAQKRLNQLPTPSFGAFPDQEALLIERINELLRKSYDETKRKELEEDLSLITSDFERLKGFLIELNGKYCQSPIFQYIKPRKLASIIRKYTDQQLLDLYNIFYQRYQPEVLKRYEVEFPVLLALKDLLNANTKERKRKSIRNERLNRITSVLATIETVKKQPNDQS